MANELESKKRYGFFIILVAFARAVWYVVSFVFKWRATTTKKNG